MEFVDAFVEDRLDRLGPGNSIPPKSYRRMLRLEDDGYAALFERIEMFLEKGEVQKEVAAEAPPEVAPSVEQGTLEEVPTVEFDDSIESDVLETATEMVEVDLFQSEVDDETDGALGVQVVEFEEEFARPIETVAKRQFVSKSDQALLKFIDMFEDTESTEELLQRLLDMLVHQAPFECAALLAIDPERKEAWPVTCRGRSLTGSDGQVIALNDPLSPILNLSSKVVSYSQRGKIQSPFGCSNFAVAPLEARHEKPVVLYADCGDGNILTFESRRLFRKVVDMLNNILPELEGEIPIEMKRDSDSAVPEPSSPEQDAAPKS